MQIAHKIELNPNNKQKTYFKKASGVSRFVWNWALAEWRRLYEGNQKCAKEKRVQISGMSLNCTAISEARPGIAFPVRK